MSYSRIKVLIFHIVDGSLENSTGIYTGQFKNGEKNGKGKYLYKKTKMRYEGNYVNGIKQGKGTAYNFDNSIAFSGNWEAGVPNGQGFVTRNGKKH